VVDQERSVDVEQEDGRMTEVVPATVVCIGAVQTYRRPCLSVLLVVPDLAVKKRKAYRLVALMGDVK